MSRWRSVHGKGVDLYADSTPERARMRNQGLTRACVRVYAERARMRNQGLTRACVLPRVL